MWQLIFYYTCKKSDFYNVQVTWLRFNITIEDINDNAPVFTQSNYSLSVDEETTKPNIITVKVRLINTHVYSGMTMQYVKSL